MLEIKIVRENPQHVIERLAVRGKDFTQEIEKLLEIDKERREISSKTDTLKAQRNTASKEIGVKKSKGENTDAVMAEMKQLSDDIKALDESISKLEIEQESLLLTIPNLPDSSVPTGNSDAENVEVKQWGTPRTFDFSFLPHWDLGKNLNILDSERAAKVTGSRFHFYKGLGAKLERALINFYLDTHSKNGYIETIPPFMVNKASMQGTGQLPKFAEDMFKIENTDYYLIPTAEVPLTNLYAKEILEGEDLPLYHTAYSPCFRAEAGSAGRDTRGLLRQHQFSKVEMVKFVKPQHSMEELEKMTEDAQRLLEALKLPYRVVALCGGDLGFSATKTYDIEVWLPSYERYVEISSCSNVQNFQAIRANIKYKETPKEKAEFVHTLNGSGLAVGRTIAAILENYQNPDGSITIPEVLIPYMGGCEIIK